MVSSVGFLVPRPKEGVSLDRRTVCHSPEGWRVLSTVRTLPLGRTGECHRYVWDGVTDVNNCKIKFKIYSTAPAWEGFPAGVLASAPLSRLCRSESFRCLSILLWVCCCIMIREFLKTTKSYRMMEPEMTRRLALHWESWWLSGVEATIEWESLKRHKNSPQWRGGENSGWIFDGVV